MTTTPRGAGRIDKVWCEEAADIDPAAWAALGKPRGTGSVYTVCHDDLVDPLADLPEMNLAKHIIQPRPGFTTTPPDCPVIGMKGITRSGDEVELTGTYKNLYYNLFWSTEPRSITKFVPIFTTDPQGSRSLESLTGLDIVQWQILNP